MRVTGTRYAYGTSPLLRSPLVASKGTKRTHEAVPGALLASCYARIPTYLLTSARRVNACSSSQSVSRTCATQVALQEAHTGR